jgi:glycosidase
VQNHLIRAYQYIIARYDIDGFRIDTLRYLQGNFSRSFGNAIREFALSIGKKNFFTFGEVLDGSSEQDIARFIGKNTLATNDPNSMVGVDAALDYPLFYALLPVVKAQLPPSSVIKMYEFRKQQEQFILSSHGDASRYFVTFLDNHDSKERIRFVDKNTDIDHYVYTDPAIPAPHDDQVTLALASLFCLPGIPCVYYGTEQGFHGSATAFGLTQPPDEPVREALWGYDPKFSQNSRFYQEILKIAKLRAATPALRYGRYYFRPISADGKNFAISTNPGGVLAWSRILNDKEVLIVSNTHSQQNNTLFVILDSNLSQVSDKITVLYSNKTKPAPPASITHLANVNITQTDASQGVGSINVTQISLQPMEIQVLQVERMF